MISRNCCEMSERINERGRNDEVNQRKNERDREDLRNETRTSIFTSIADHEVVEQADLDPQGRADDQTDQMHHCHDRL